jgi:hypothetical protein
MMSNEDPGGSAPGQHDNPDFSGLQNNFNQQQVRKQLEGHLYTLSSINTNEINNLSQ